MTALNFKAQFAGPVERREKRQSIRQNNRFKVGEPIQLYTGMRTKGCRKLVDEDPICILIEPIVIAPDYVSRGTWRLPSGDLIAFARSDGFASVEDFRSFFVINGKPFHGFLIKWDWR